MTQPILNMRSINQSDPVGKLRLFWRRGRGKRLGFFPLKITRFRAYAYHHGVITPTGEKPKQSKVFFKIGTF